MMISSSVHLKSRWIIINLLPLLLLNNRIAHRSQGGGEGIILTGAAIVADADVEHPKCRLYLAESTIPNAGLGIFTGINLHDGDRIAEPDIVVPLHDLDAHVGSIIDYELLWKQYSWNLEELGLQYDVHDGYAIVLGTGCVPNCNFALINAKEGRVRGYDHAGLHRSTDVGTSGFTGYHDQRMYATSDVPAGGEIFVSYGEHWFESRRRIVGNVPFESNYHEVDVFLAKFKYLTLKHGGSTTTTNGFSRDLWDVVTALGKFDTRNANALPVSFGDMLTAQSIGSAMSLFPYSVRSLEWLETNGRCMDNIRPGNSTIRQAGRGAFASRYIPEGGLVAPGPLLHVANKSAFYLYANISSASYLHDDDDDDDDDNDVPSGYQLLLNYCFGHRRSTVLLCPYTSPSAYINHGSGELTNVVIRWSEPSTPNHNAHWLEEDVDYLKSTVGVGLSMDFIATRDIQPGEEVFLDYGPEWVAAWEEYVVRWRPTLGSEDYVPASLIEEPLRTVEEQYSMPYPDNVIFYCHYDYHRGDSQGSFIWEDDWMELRLCPCQIISRAVERGSGTEKGEGVEYSYTTKMLTVDQVDNIDKIPMFMWSHIVMPSLEDVVPPTGEAHVLTKVPRRAIKVCDKPYTKEEFVSGAFRHEMMIPDDVFPEAWMNA
ncbi:hypothetical protein ACHAXA_001966 [Cyclostephanos tholiformis]|uniref:SET domain-containing protein n=1 Tax=Cyclostephanos tholiformis TaxID=382380 RepID=A0ABD3RRI9_9STRA